MAMRDARQNVSRSPLPIGKAGKPDRRARGPKLMAAAALAGTLLAGWPATAQPVCGDRAEILENLAKFHTEQPQAMGLSTDGKLVEVLVSATGSWSILVSLPSQMTCLVATGEHWERLPAADTGPSA